MKAEILRKRLNIFLILCSVALLLVIIWQQFFMAVTVTQQGIQLVQPAPAVSANLSWRWFGEAGPDVQARQAEEDEQEQLAEASINAELLGVVRTQDRATATISINGQPEKVFSIGDEIQSGIELLSVTTSRIILNERGRRVQITMRRPDNMLVRASNVQAGNTAASRLQNNFSLPNMFNAVPVQLENNATGFQLDSLSEEIRTLTEIEEGDVIIQVGNNSIDDLMANPGQWMNYSTETTLPVTLMRDGQETTIYVNAFSLSARILPNINIESMQ